MSFTSIAKIVLTGLFIILVSCQSGPVFIDSTNENIKYAGRINFEDETAPEIYWSGTSIKMNVTGGDVKALLKDERGENYFNIVVDKEYQSYIKRQYK